MLSYNAIEVLRKARDAIINEIIFFRMDVWLMGLSQLEGEKHGCGTAGCIAGTIATIAGVTPVIDEDVFEFAKTKLELSYEQADFVFLGGWFTVDGKQVDDPVNYITKEHALLYLDRVIESGNVYERVDSTEVGNADAS